MNWINKFLLSAVLLPRRFYAAWGIQVPQLVAILTTKLTMDDRRPNTMQMTRRQQKKDAEISGATLGTMAISGVMGMMYLFAFMVGTDLVTQFTFYYSMFMMMLCMMLVSDFTSVLIDVKDNFIILPKPVTGSTVVAARLLHVFIHVCKLVVPMSLPCFVYLLFRTNPWGSLVFAGITLFATLFSIFLINAVYLLILRITTPERFKNIISYIQIAFAIVIYGSFQLLPRMADRAEFSSFNLQDKLSMLLAPPFWFASAFHTLFAGSSGSIEWVAVALALALPPLSIFVVVKFLAPAFNQKLAMISGSDDGGTTAAPGTSAPKGLAGTLARWCTQGKAEHTGFLFAWKMMSRSREFKVKVYPSIGYLVVLVVLFFFRNSRQEDLDVQQLFAGFKPIVAVYFSSMILLVAIHQIMVTEKFKAAWMFFITPLQRPGHLIHGALTAVLMQFFTAIAFVLLALGLWLGGTGILPNLLLALCNQLLITYAVSAINFTQLPFSQPVNEGEKGGQFVRGVLLVVISGVLGMLHFFVFRQPISIGIVLALSITGILLLRWYIRRKTWLDIEFAD
ncbi:MAG: hypothetical protein IT260_05560 [Saprospiraceae bacterium]|nr:hypothetical protein [Saprospiraceae bacterium]